MTKQELFKKYDIDESHNVWETGIDSWISVDIYKIMKGKLPDQYDMSLTYVLEFLDKAKNDIKWWKENVMCHHNWGSYYLTAKRMVRTLHENIINEINSPTK